MRIIFADGHENFRTVVVDLLREHGHEVHACATGGELVATAKRVSPDVIISHARFDDLPTLEAIEYLACAGVRVPTLLMSGDIDAIPRADAARLGVTGYLAKPFSISELRAALDIVALNARARQRVVDAASRR